jgi:hypothetical protein
LSLGDSAYGTEVQLKDATTALNAAGVGLVTATASF